MKNILRLFGALFFLLGAGLGGVPPGAAAPALPARPATPDRPSVDSGRLEAEIARIAAASEGVVGVSAVHLSTGATVDYNADQRFKMASTFKLPVAVYAMHLADAARLSLVDPLPVARQEMIEPGILHEYFRHPGLAISTLNAIELSLTRSDNGATDIIYGRVGGPAAVNAWLRSRGYADIDLGRQTIRETFSDQATPPVAAANGVPDRERTTTPRAMRRFLADLHRGRLLGADRTAAIMDIMSRTVGDRISLHLPPGVTVLHKTGTLFGTDGLSVNDIGYIRTADGQTIAIAVFIRQSPERVAHAMRDSVIGNIARAVYDHFVLAPARERPLGDNRRPG